MGSILARFKKKKDTKAVLESLEDEIMYIENMTSNTSPINYYKIVFHSAIMYGFIYILYYFGIIPYELFKNNYIMAVFAAYPIIALYYYKFDVWYYNRKIVTYKKKLIELKSVKKKILDEVMEKETFKVAKEILEKYAPHQLQSMTSQNFINQRALPSTNNRPPYASSGRPMTRTSNMGHPPAIMSSTVKPRLALPRPVLSRDRTIFDRLADKVLGDGPQNRYALICRTCGSHNGMARKEEFDFLAYRCAYCSQWNPSLKPRPQLAISYNNNALTQNGYVASTETIEEITDEMSKTDSDTNDSEHSEHKDLIINDSGPIIEEVVDPSHDLKSKTEDKEESKDNSASVAEESLQLQT
ncbi:endoplasmic reticulum junction formation protein lunapark [Rhopalosiphum padi]|uniref:endoplasmic reticulum junction formation protein lunapark n=1 Tax=Rhopalosiphum padi TaxID=40932 RepID=UPI00298E063E|nr:endoplasmic reticulum junction formation protein lunapark [Rhopalosiphum padi]XP_060854835.1 endoplasmic reticulum junction formation protein lunapark [Rhopalosiphum padi]